ncbi:MAG TPA: electron transfer flavoprotein subunit alpha/FixB family protein [Candidatus Eremiobacteraceae bacterium]|nr:electron transfer flavoprotein subunit alpha/FixB family protein [Candidatus Eremiobacteraceae bacterium]
MDRIFAYISHKDGVADDTAAEFVTAAKKIDAAAIRIAVVTGCGMELDKVCKSLAGDYAEIWKVDNQAIAYPNAELIRKVLVDLLPGGGTLLVAHNHFGMDLSPGLSVKLRSAFVSDVVNIEGIEGTELKLVRQEFGGQVSTHIKCDISSGAVLNIRPGAFKPREPEGLNGRVVDKSALVGTLAAKRRFVRTIAVEAGGVDITKELVLVSIGRGIQERDNVAIAEELAEAMGAVVSCSRPVVDAKWLEKSRQVGSSGKTVKPKVYLACGISGSFQHLAGLKGNPFVVAINKNPKAPIFQVAEVGIIDDILEFLPELTTQIRETAVMKH